MNVSRVLPLLLALTLAGAPASGEEPPPAELLEFVGSWQGADGTWLDPVQLEGWRRMDDKDDDAHADKI